MKDKAVFRTPLKRLRALIAVVCWAFAGLSFFTFFLYSQEGLPSFLTGAVFVVAGLAVVFLERVCVVDGRARSISCAWFLGDRRVSPGQTVRLDGADAVRLALVESVIFPWDKKVLKVNKAFPVWIMSGEKAMAYVIGWKQPEDPKSEQGGWNFGIWNSAWFPEYARFVAAVCAKVLELPLVDQKNGRTISVAEIPEAWLDPDKVRFNLLWESAF